MRKGLKQNNYLQLFPKENNYFNCLPDIKNHRIWSLYALKDRLGSYFGNLGRYKKTKKTHKSRIKKRVTFVRKT